MRARDIVMKFNLYGKLISGPAFVTAYRKEDFLVFEFHNNVVLALKIEETMKGIRLMFYRTSFFEAPISYSDEINVRLYWSAFAHEADALFYIGDSEDARRQTYCELCIDGKIILRYGTGKLISFTGFDDGNSWCKRNYINQPVGACLTSGWCSGEGVDISCIRDGIVLTFKNGMRFPIIGGSNLRPLRSKLGFGVDELECVICRVYLERPSFVSFRLIFCHDGEFIMCDRFLLYKDGAEYNDEYISGVEITKRLLLAGV